MSREEQARQDQGNGIPPRSNDPIYRQAYDAAVVKSQEKSGTSK